MSVPKHVCNELLKLNLVKFYGSRIKIEEMESTRGQTIVVSSPAKNLPLVPGKQKYCKAKQHLLTIR